MTPSKPNPRGADPSHLVDAICLVAERARRDGLGSLDTTELIDDDLRWAVDLASSGVEASEILRGVEARIFALSLIAEGMSGVAAGEDPAALRAHLAALLGREARSRLRAAA